MAIKNFDRHRRWKHRAYSGDPLPPKSPNNNVNFSKNGLEVPSYLDDIFDDITNPEGQFHFLLTGVLNGHSGRSLWSDPLAVIPELLYIMIDYIEFSNTQEALPSIIIIPIIRHSDA